MPKLTKIYTKTGDDGTTALGTRIRVPKDALRVCAYGDVDELNAAIGVAIASDLSPGLAGVLTEIQNELFNLGTVLAFPEDQAGDLDIPRIEMRHVERLEVLIDQSTATVGQLENFILPGGSQGASLLHLARTICRRAERSAVTLAREEPVDVLVIKYLNRLSDALFVMARQENKARAVAEALWNSKA
jgi:cob(I)alamin adenosyltransferase